MTRREDSPTPDFSFEAARKGDVEAFRSFVRTHERRVATLVARILDNPQDIEEATQDTFVQAWRHLDQFRGDAAITTWLFRIATNASLMRVRRRRHSQITLDDARSTAEQDGADVTAEASLRLQQVRLVRAALASLPRDVRAAVVLRDIEGLTTTEAAEVLGLAESALKTRLHRGRMRLRVLLRDQLADEQR
ncbi:MAG: sigma-70 family RNA polymerase sigma factor [Acidimicrobiales bacterium]